MRCAPASAGYAVLHLDRIEGQSVATRAESGNPLKLLVPRSRGKSVWACLSSYGGGMVAGDETRLDVHVGAGARGWIGTQSSTKIYRNPENRTCRHQTCARIEKNGILVLAPDVVQAFADACYSQRQEFHLETGAGLLLLDWLSAGRTARGERWAFRSYGSRNDIFINNHRIFVDALLLEPAAVPLAGPHRLGRFNCIATLVFAGEPFREAAGALFKQIADQPVGQRETLVSSASPFSVGTVLRIAGTEVEQVANQLHSHLTFLQDLLGDDPFNRKW